MQDFAAKVRRWLGPLPGRREAHAISWMALAVGAILCAISIFRGFHGETFLGRPLGGDFIEFYVIGKILNSYEAIRIYDLQLAVALQHANLPEMGQDQMLVFGHAPYIAPLFRVFAMLPYRWAYVAWLAFSASLYLISLGLLFRCSKLGSQDRKTGLLLAISSVPFLLETWIGGQLSVVVFFAWALCLYFRGNHRWFIAGVALSLVLFKPTLLGLPVIMLICGREWRMLGGVLSGAAGFVLASFGIVGVNGCRAWLDTLAFNARAVAGTRETIRIAKQLDLLSFFQLLVPNSGALAGMLAGAVAIVLLSLIAAAWLRLRKFEERAPRDLLLAATICLTLVVSSYAPIYDSILVAAAVLSASAILVSSEYRETFQGWLVLLYLVPWITQSFAEFLHVQLFTVLLVGFAVWLLKMAQLGCMSGKREDSRSCNSAGPETLLEPTIRLSSKKVLC